MGRLLNFNEFENGLRDQLSTIPVDLRPMMPGFLERKEKDLQELRRLLKAQDFVGIRYIGHKLKGTGGGFGLQVISEIGGELEAAANEEDLNRTKEFVRHLANATKFLKIYFNF
jgi:HPt (histidine-containing phosphotransfer) domain-containing protein